MQEYYIDINTVDNDINPVFIKASGYLIRTYNSVFANSNSDSSKNLILEKLWHENFNSTLIKTDINSNIWNKIVFNDYQSMTLFLLKWY
jgi:hypothetical protein